MSHSTDSRPNPTQASTGTRLVATARVTAVRWLALVGWVFRARFPIGLRAFEGRRFVLSYGHAIRVAKDFLNPSAETRASMYNAVRRRAKSRDRTDLWRWRLTGIAQAPRKLKPTRRFRPCVARNAFRYAFTSLSLFVCILVQLDTVRPDVF